MPRHRLSSLLSLAFLGIVPLNAAPPEVHPDIVEHFKYGSIGAEARTGIPIGFGWRSRALSRTFCRKSQATAMNDSALSTNRESYGQSG